jgi:hypothetical protein
VYVDSSRPVYANCGHWRRAEKRTSLPAKRATAVARARSDPERRHGLGMLKRRAGRVDANLTGRWIDLPTPPLVTSASGANGNGYGALLAFDHDGESLGPFSDDDRIVDPRGLAPEPEPGLLFLNSADRVLALDQAGKVVRDTGVIAGLNPGGGTFGPDGRYYVGLPRRSDCPGAAARFEELGRTRPAARDRALSPRIWVQRRRQAVPLLRNRT